MGVCSSRPNVTGDPTKEAGETAKATVTFQENADTIRHFKSGHHDDPNTLQQAISMENALESFKSRAASFASSMSEGGLAGEVLGDINSVLRDATPSTKQGKNSKRRSKQQKQQDTLALPPGATRSPRESEGGTTSQRPSGSDPAPTPTSPMAALATPATPPEDSTRAKSAPEHQDSNESAASEAAAAAAAAAAGAGADPAVKERQRRPTVTFEAAAGDRQSLNSDPTRGVVRNKSRLKVASQPGQAPDTSAAPSPTSEPNSVQSLKSSKSANARTRCPPPPVLPMLPQLPAAKGGASEPGLWVLRRTGNVRHKYILADALGRGQFGAVCIAMDRATGERWACKSVSKRRVQGMHDFSMADVLREVEVLYTVGGHPGVVGLREVYEDDEDLHLILELCEGGDWFERLINFGRYTEAEAATTIRSMLEALSYCHSLGVMHRDIKPENIMFVDRTDTSAVKLTDFGLAALFTEGGPMLSEVLGSAYYVAPEVLREAYSKEADIWSTGIVLFIALGGYAPFDGANEREVFSKILHEPLEFKDSSWAHISQDAKDVILSMLTKDPRHRGTIKDLLARPWFATCAGTLTPQPGTPLNTPITSPVAAGPKGLPAAPITLESSLTSRMAKGSIAKAVATAVKKGKVVRSVPDAVVARLQQFSAMNAFKRQARRVLATYLPEEEVVGLMQVFKDMDKDGDGLLTLRELQEGLADRGVAITDANAKLMLARTDLDGDGAVDYGEFLAATLHLARLERDERLYRAFRFFDKDGSGFITRDELETGLSHLGRVNVERILAEVDTDGDGRICYTEFCDMLRHDATPSMNAFMDNPLDSATSWGAWGEHTDSGRLLLAMPHDSAAPSRNLSTATSRNASGNDRNSYASMGAVSIRRSLGGNLLFGSRNARASGTGQATRPSQAGTPLLTRPSYNGNVRPSLAGSSRFGSMRAAALMAAAASDSSGRSSARTFGSQDSGHKEYRDPQHRPATLTHAAVAHAAAQHAAHTTAQRLQDVLEVVTEMDSSMSGNHDHSSRSPSGVKLETLIQQEQQRMELQRQQQQQQQLLDQSPPNAHVQHAGHNRSITEGGHMPTPFGIPPVAPVPPPQPPPATPTAWGEAPGAAHTHNSPRHGQVRTTPPQRSTTEHGHAATTSTRTSTLPPIGTGLQQRQTNTDNGTPSDVSSPDGSLWRQVRAVGSDTVPANSPLGGPLHSSGLVRGPGSNGTPPQDPKVANTGRPGSAQPF